MVNRCTMTTAARWAGPRKHGRQAARSKRGPDRTGMRHPRAAQPRPWLDGESIKVLSEYLGHADPGFTLRTYTHLMPAGSQRTCRAVDSVFRSPGVPEVVHEQNHSGMSDGLVTA
jgi:integrase